MSFFSTCKPLVFWLVRIGPLAHVLAFHLSWVSHYHKIGIRLSTLIALCVLLGLAILVGFMRKNWAARSIGVGIAIISGVLMAFPVPNMAAMPPVAYLWPFVSGLSLFVYGNSR